jgi:hypothetical protein
MSNGGEERALPEQGAVDPVDLFRGVRPREEGLGSVEGRVVGGRRGERKDPWIRNITSETG